VTFLRRYAQTVHAPKTHVVDAPVEFSERAYAAGLEPDSGSVETRAEDVYWIAELKGKVGGVAIRLLGVGADERAALEAVLLRLEGLARGKGEGRRFDI